MNYPSKPITTFIELHTASQKLLDQIMWNCAGTNVLDDDLHLGVVREATILLFKSKMCEM